MINCPRRAENPGPWRYDEGPDTYIDGRCSYCGSVEPGEFLQAVRDGVEVGPTDKNYKAYLAGHRKFYYQHLSAEQRREFIDLYNDNTMKVGYPGYFYVLPFFVKPRAEHE